LLKISDTSYLIANVKIRESLPSHPLKIHSVFNDEVNSLETLEYNEFLTTTDISLFLHHANIINDFFDETSNYLTQLKNNISISLSYNINIHDKVFRIKNLNVQSKYYTVFENQSTITILVISKDFTSDFLITDLFYPYKYFLENYHKNVRLLFVQHLDSIFRLIEFKFNSQDNMNSLEYIKEKRYSLTETELSIDDVGNILQKVKVKTNDNQDNTDVPFVQANSFDKIITMMEHLNKKPSDIYDLEMLLNVSNRQVSYYYNAGRYVGLFKKNSLSNKYCLTETGEQLMLSNYRNRQLSFISLILEHKIFNDLFHKIFNGTFPSKTDVLNLMKKYNVCNSTDTTSRRAESVLAWIKWVLQVVDGSDDF